MITRMDTAKIRYKEGYKYQLADPYWIQTDIITGQDYSIPAIIKLDATGLLYIYHCYAWDGPSGPTFDTRNSMRASLIHDALYQLMGVYPELLLYREVADDLLYKILKKDGMWSVRAWLWKKTVNWFGKHAAETDDEILEAP